MLEKLCDNEILIPIEGGGYWINRTFRDRVYSFNSRFTSPRKLVELLSKNKLNDVSEEIDQAGAQALLLALHHDRIARYYYFDNYMMSQDVNAFFEYVYHRVSSIRFLTRLLLYLKLLNNKTNANATLTFEYLDRINGIHDYLDSIPDAKQDIGDLVKSIKIRRDRELRSLHRTWLRCQADIRRYAPAEELIGWCKWIVDNDLERFSCNCLLKILIADVKKRRDNIQNKQAPPNIRSIVTILNKIKKVSIGDESQISEEIKIFRETLLDVVAKCSFERSDYQLCIQERWKQIKKYYTKDKKDKQTILNECKEWLEVISTSREIDTDWFDKINKTLGLTTNGAPPKEQFKKIHYWIDIASSLQHLEYESAFPLAERLFRWMNRLLNQFEGMRDDVFQDARLRLDYRHADLKLSKLSFWKNRTLRFLDEASGKEAEDSGGSEPENDGMKRIQKRVVTITEKALKRVREQDPKAEPMLWDPLIGQPRDGSLYRNYRSLFQIVKGRAASVKGAEAGFDEAYRDFELARGGIDPDDHLLMALPELFGAECCLIHSDFILNHSEKDDPEGLNRIRLAGNKYRMASGLLKRARTQILSGRRNVIWWKFFFQLVAQYQAERVLRRVVELRYQMNLPSKERRGPLIPSTHVAQIVARLRKGLAAIRQGIDYSLEVDDSPDENLTRIWFELAFGGFAYSTLCLDASGVGLDRDETNKKKPNENRYRENRENSKKSQITTTLNTAKEFFTHWEWLNKSAGIDGEDSGLGVIHEYLPKKNSDPKESPSFTNFLEIIKSLKSINIKFPDPIQPDPIQGGKKAQKKYEAQIKKQHAEIIEHVFRGFTEQTNPFQLRRDLIKQAESLSKEIQKNGRDQ